MVGAKFRFLSFPCVILISACLTAMASISKPGCPSMCGDITIPYPFGIGSTVDGPCSMDFGYSILCNTSYNPPKPFYRSDKLHEIVDISETGQMRLKNSVAKTCYADGDVLSSVAASMSFPISPLFFSDTLNKFTVVGCDDDAVISGSSSFYTGCFVGCSKPSDVTNGYCDGIGCCQTSIPKGFKVFAAVVESLFHHASVSSFNPCSYAFLAEESKYTFNVDDLSNTSFSTKIEENVPVVLEWVVGMGNTCDQARSNSSSYPCHQNTNCTDIASGTTKGYRCNCLPGFVGNPYLSPGCTDIDECAGSNNPCSHLCINTPGSYRCSCLKGQLGDGLKNGTGCTGDNYGFILKLSLGLGIGSLFLLAVTILMYFTVKRRNLLRTREKFFERNGGILLKQQFSQSGGTTDLSKIFSADDLSAATNNYSDDRILGKGGYGTVYKGILIDGREVAIKKSRVSDQSQVEQFINEVVILTQINHRNVVKLLGCCLETEVPLLVYEFISHGTLSEHLSMKGAKSWLSWANCVRLATEAADAFAYLHSAASIPIIHRDVKSANILIDDSYTVKISDFGASRLIPIDQTQLTTLVQGTLGYLDPEYFHTSQLTVQSDVYSYGVVLAELLTREKPLSLERDFDDRNLANYFVVSMKKDRLLEIVDPQLVKEASKEQLLSMANLAKKCLNVKGEDRPTMREVFIELEGLKKQISHRWDEQNFQGSDGQQDLYPVFSNNFIPRNGEFSENNTMQNEIAIDMSPPR